MFIEDVIISSTTVNISFSVHNISYTPETYHVVYQGLVFQTTVQSSERISGPTDITVRNQFYDIVINQLEEASNYTFRIISTNCIGNTSSQIVNLVTKESCEFKYTHVNVLIV